MTPRDVRFRPICAVRILETQKVLAVAMLAALSLALAACSPSPPPKFKATDITGSGIGGDFELPDHNGAIRRLAEFRGKAVVVFFGFTSCPDVCPTTLQRLAQTMKRLGPDADAVQVIMITVDPARDSKQVMSQYVTSFDSRFIGLVPGEEALRQAAGQFKVYINRNKPNADGFYTVDHTAAFFVFDRRGRIRLYVRDELSSNDLTADLRVLLREGGGN